MVVVRIQKRLGATGLLENKECLQRDKIKPRGTLPPRNLKEMEEPAKETGGKMAREEKGEKIVELVDHIKCC